MRFSVHTPGADRGSSALSGLRELAPRRPAQLDSPTVPPAFETFTVFMPASASVRVVRAVPGPHDCHRFAVGRRSRWSSGFVEVSLDDEVLCCHEGVTNAASPAAAYQQSNPHEVSSCVAVQDRTKSTRLFRPPCLMRVRHQRRVPLPKAMQEAKSPTRRTCCCGATAGTRTVAIGLSF